MTKRFTRIVSESPRPSVIFALVLALGFRASPLRAQTSETQPTAAEVLFEEGRRLMGLGEYAEACAKFRESQRLDSGTGTLMNLGRCYVKQGRTASAWTTYRQAAALAHAAGQDERERVARQEIAVLEVELAKVRLLLSPEARALKPTVTLDESELGAGLWDVPTPVDPGEHSLTVSAADRTPWTRHFRVEPRQTETIEIPAPAARAQLRASDAQPQAVEADGWRLHHTAAVIAAGLGIVGLGLGAYWTVSAHSDYDAGRKFCVDEIHCSQDGVDLRESAIAQGRLATISFVIGGTGLAGGTVLWFTAPSLKSRSPSDVREAARPEWLLEVGGVW